MPYVIRHAKHGYVIKRGSMNDFTKDKSKATYFSTEAEAIKALPGHHKDMGGKGIGHNCYISKI